MSKKVLISGVTGQDGSYMADYLLANTDYEIYGMIRRTSKPDLSNLKNAMKSDRFKIVIGDLSDSQSIDNLVWEIKPDYFINLAAQSFVATSWNVPEQTFDIDATGVIRCLEAVRKHAPLCRFYNAGSSEQFGDVVYSPQDFNHPFRARSPYGAAKIAAQQIVKTYRESYGLYAVQGVLFNHESERRGEEFVTRKITLGVARIAKSLRQNNFKFDPIRLGNMDARRDWSHAEDFVRGIWMMLNQEDYVDHPLDLYMDELEQVKYYSKHIKEYVLASGETHSIKEFIELAFGFAGIKGVWWKNLDGKEEYLYSTDGVLATKAYIPLVVTDPKFYRPADVELLQGDSTPARQELGWKPAIPFAELARRMVENDLKNNLI